VSHDAPPTASPQALRTARFVEAIGREAASVVLICARMTRDGECALPGDNIRVLATSPGWFEASILALSRASRARSPAGPPTPTAPPPGLNWKGQVVKAARRALDWACFPDSRIFWALAARRTLLRELSSQRFDVALLMHEPAAALTLSPLLSRAGIPWMVDLADPVATLYTPAHWRRRALRLEADALAGAAAWSVTNDETSALLSARNPKVPGIGMILPQGFTRRAGSRPATPPNREGDALLTVVYTGRFYAFRSPSAFVQALKERNDVRMVVACPEPPESLMEAANQFPDRFELLGLLPHAESLQLQSRADVLLSIGNAGTVQSPGKVVEYLGMESPILHLVAEPGDAAARLVESAGAGLVAMNLTPDIHRALDRLVSAKQAGTLAAGFTRDELETSRYEWSTIGKSLCSALGRIASQPPAS